LVAVFAAMTVTACNRPISKTAELDGCGFAGANPNPAFEIRDAKLTSPFARSTIALSSIKSGTRALRLSPGVRVTDDDHKSTILVAGDETTAIAFQSGRTKYIIFGGNSFPATFELRGCR
jgi:hypothetical protein